jgi:hypothetical protein
LGNIGLEGKIVGQWTQDIVRSTILYIPLRPCGNSKSRWDQRDDEEGRSPENERKVHGDSSAKKRMTAGGKGAVELEEPQITTTRRKSVL